MTFDPTATFRPKTADDVYIHLMENTVEDENGCWVAFPQKQGSNGGYKYVKLNGNRIYAHRFVWEMNNETIPKKKIILHSCDNPACVNPDHLSVGTHADNAKDKAAKGRAVSGEKHPGAKLFPEAAAFIKRTHRNYNEDLACFFGVTRSTIHSIRTGNTWKNI